MRLLLACFRELGPRKSNIIFSNERQKLTGRASRNLTLRCNRNNRVSLPTRCRIARLWTTRASNVYTSRKAPNGIQIVDVLKYQTNKKTGEMISWSMRKAQVNRPINCRTVEKEAVSPRRCDDDWKPFRWKEEGIYPEIGLPKADARDKFTEFADTSDIKNLGARLGRPGWNENWPKYIEISDQSLAAVCHPSIYFCGPVCWLFRAGETRSSFFFLYIYILLSVRWGANFFPI